MATIPQTIKRGTDYAGCNGQIMTMGELRFKKEISERDCVSYSGVAVAASLGSPIDYACIDCLIVSAMVP